MRIWPRLTILALIIFCAAAHGQTIMEQRSTDTVWVDSIATHSGQKAVLEVFLANADTINAFDVPLTYKYPDLLIDSVSFVGSRVENRFLTVVEIDTAAAICHFGGFYFDITNEEVGPGSGLLARIFMTIPDDYPARLIPFDTTRLVTGLTLVTRDDVSYVPVFQKGYVDNAYAPHFDDSVWVDDVTVVPGEEFVLALSSYNELPIYNIKIPLRYYSDNIVFDSMSVAGTRAENAVVVEVLPDNQASQVLISMRFDDGQLLPEGSGALANLYFTCLLSGTSTQVDMDTTDFGGFEYYFQLGNLFSYVKIYPEFQAGQITIDFSTDVNNETTDNLPTTFELAQNYPNPFNPTTVIDFALPRQSEVVMEVFNILGQRVRQLVNETLPAGNHTVIFDGRDDDGGELASGIYLYRIRTDGYSQSRKMMLMK